MWCMKMNLLLPDWIQNIVYLLHQNFKSNNLINCPENKIANLFWRSWHQYIFEWLISCVVPLGGATRVARSILRGGQNHLSYIEGTRTKPGAKFSHLSTISVPSDWLFGKYIVCKYIQIQLQIHHLDWLLNHSWQICALNKVQFLIHLKNHKYKLSKRGKLTAQTLYKCNKFEMFS